MGRGVFLRMEQQRHISYIIKIALWHLLLHHSIDFFAFYYRKRSAKEPIHYLIDTMMTLINAIVRIIFHIINNQILFPIKITTILTHLSFPSVIAKKGIQILTLLYYLQLIRQTGIMKTNTAVVNNKKLILHFDVHQVLTVPSDQDKDLYIYQLCSTWVWGRLQRNSKENPDLVTGWKIAVNTLSADCPEPDLINYKTYLHDYVKPPKDQYVKLILNLSKGPAAKVKSQFEKNIKNITLPKSLAQAIKQGSDTNNKLLNYFNKTGKYQILPAFFKLLLNLKKSKRQFAVVIKNDRIKDFHQDIIGQLNQFYSGEHPLYNGKNGTPAVKWDGSKGTKNFIIEQTHQAVYYRLEQGELFATYGTLNVAQQKDIEMFKQKFKSFKTVRLCEKPQEIYSVSHSILAESACIYEINPLKTVVIDPVDYLTHQIYFTSSNAQIYSCLNEEIADKRSFVVKVNPFDYYKDVDYFIKNVEALEGQRVAEITKIEKKEGEEQEEAQAPPQEQKMTNYQYLKKNLLPVLEGALRQVDLLRPEDPIGFIALYCLKNRERLQ